MGDGLAMGGLAMGTWRWGDGDWGDGDWHACPQLVVFQSSTVKAGGQGKNKGHAGQSPSSLPSSLGQGKGPGD